MHKQTLFTRGWKLVSIAILASILLSLLGNVLAEPNVLRDAYEPNESWSGSASDSSSSSGGYDEPTDGEFLYRIHDDEAIVVEYIGEESDVTVPPTFEGYPVTTIDCYAFTKANVTSVVLSSSVQTIKEYAFLSSSLTSVTIPASVTSIGDAAFGYCENLRSITVLEGNPNYESIDNCLIETATGTLLRGTRDGAIPSGVKVIGVQAFSGLTKLPTVVIPGGVTTIKVGAFAACSNLCGVFIPDSVTVIEVDTFSYYPSLTIYCEAENQPEGWEMGWKDSETEVVWNADPASAPTLGVDGDYTYMTANGTATILSYDGWGENVIVPDTLGGCPVTTIGYEAFYNVNSILSIELPGSVTRIKNAAFSYCYHVETIKFPASLQTIEENAFHGCVELTGITLPASVTSIGFSAFGGCGEMEYIAVQAGNPTYEAVGDCLIEKATDTLVFGCKNSVIPSSVTTIGVCAFSECFGLTSLVIPDNVTAIEQNAFFRCYNMVSIFIPDSVTEMGWIVFDDCSKLDIYCEAEKQPAGWDDVWISYGFNTENVHWGASSDDMPVLKTEGDFTYTTADGKSTVLLYNGESNIVFIPDTLGGYPVTAIGKGAFCNFHYFGILGIELPDSITSIGAHAFDGCDSLQSIFIPAGVTEMGLSAFGGCTELTIYCEAEKQPESWDKNWNPGRHDNENVIWGVSREEAPAVTLYETEGDFSYGISKRKVTVVRYDGRDSDVTVPETLGGYPVTAIGTYAFYSKPHIESIKLPSCLERIETDAFFDCDAMQSIEIPASVTSIMEGAFNNCENLHITVQTGNTNYEVSGNCLIEKDTGTLLHGCNDSVIPSNVKVIGVNAFSGCTFATIEIPNGVTAINDGAFINCELYNIFIPASVTKMGRTIFGYNYDLIIYCEAKTRPDGWDEYWVPDPDFAVVWGVSRSDVPVVGNEGDFVYSALNGQATITTYRGDDKNVTVPSTLGGFPVTAIGENAFYACWEMESVKLPAGLKTVEAYAFFDCDALKSIEIPASVTSIGESAFGDCEKLEKITVQTGNTIYESAGNCLIEKKTGKLLRGCASSVIPSNVKSIGSEAFSDCKITSIHIPNGVTTIEHDAFWDCDALTDVTIPSSVTSIGVNAFRWCTALKSIVIPKSVTTIGALAFADCYELTIYCEAEKQPEGWDESWADNTEDGETVQWGYVTRLLGDVDGKNGVDANDYMMVKRHVLRTFKLNDEQKAVADVNKSGDIDANDYMMVKRHVLRTFKLPTA